MNEATTLEAVDEGQVAAGEATEPATDLSTRLTVFLTAQGALGDRGEVTGLRRLIGGYSREMWFFAIRRDGRETPYVLRMDPPELTTMLVTDRVQEWGFLRALRAEGTVRVPQAHWLDASGAELGRPAIIMERIPGRNMLEIWRSVSDEDRDIDDWAVRADELAKLVASYTRVDLSALPDFVARPTSWDDYMTACEERWRLAERSYPESVPLLRHIAGWLRANRPEPVALSLVHGDMQPNNVLADDDDRYYAVDWEMTHIGDPREDLGWWLYAELSNPAPYVSDFLERVCAVYREETGMTEAQVNPAVLRYFMVAASLGCLEDIMEQSSALAAGRTAAANVAYVSVCLPFMYSAYMNVIRDLTQTPTEAAR